MLRPLCAGDERLILPAVRESLDALMRWLPWATPAYDLKEARKFVSHMRRCFDRGTDLGFAIMRNDGAYVGSIGLHLRGDNVPRFEVGYWCRAGEAGKGYATEALRAVTSFGFRTLGARRIEVLCDAANRASARVALKSGFEREGRLRNHRRDARGRLNDTLIFSRIR